MTCVPRPNDYANDPTPNTITMSVYLVLGKTPVLIISKDKNNGDIYGMSYNTKTQKLANRKKLTTTYQTFGFGQDARAKLKSKGSDGFQLTANGRNTIFGKRSFDKGPDVNSYNYWFGASSNPNYVKKQNITVKYIDKITKQEIAKSKNYSEYGGQNYYLNTPPKFINNYSYVSSENANGYINQSDITVTYFYSINYKPNINEAKSGSNVVTGIGVPDDKIEIQDENNNSIGTGTVNSDGTFKIELNRELREDETISANSEKGKNSSSVNVTFNADDHQPNLDELKDRDTTVTGTGIPGDKITITSGTEEKIGTTTVDSDGNFKVELSRPLEEDETISATPTVNGNKGTSSSVNVNKSDDSSSYSNNDNPDTGTNHTVIVNPIKDGDKALSGKGKPGDTVIIKDKNGNQIGTGTVDKDGNLTAKKDDGTPFEKGEVITVTPVTDGKTGQESGKITVGDKDKNTDNNGNDSSVTVPSTGDKVISGNGKPGSNVEIKDGNGNLVGKGTIDDNGNFSINVGNKINDGDKYTVIISGSKKPIIVSPNNRPDNRIKKNTVVYSLKPIYLYKNTIFKKTERKAYYTKKPRINRPMFVVKNIVKNANGLYRYQVRDVNHRSSTYGKTGYITTKKNYVLPVYYYGKHNTITVINPRGVNEYKNKNLTGKVNHIKRGSTFKVNQIVCHNLTTRYKLSNGNYVTTNKKFIKMLPN